jgi:hypothetical protein
VRLTINALGHAADYGAACLGKLAGEEKADLAAVAGGKAGTDQGHCRLLQRGDIAPAPEQCGRIRKLKQKGGVRGISAAEQPHTCFDSPFLLLRGPRAGLRKSSGIVEHCGQAGADALNLCYCLASDQDCLRAAKGGKQTLNQGWP